MAKLVDTRNQDWQPVRPELTSGVTGKLLLDGPTKVVLTKVEPGGAFRPHSDNYSHLFYLLSGQAIVRVEDKEYQLSAGISLQVDPGERHEYKNCGQEELLLIAMNLSKT